MSKAMLKTVGHFFPITHEGSRLFHQILGFLVLNVHSIGGVLCQLRNEVTNFAARSSVCIIAFQSLHRGLNLTDTQTHTQTQDDTIPLKNSSFLFQCAPGSSFNDQGKEPTLAGFSNHPWEVQGKHLAVQVTWTVTGVEDYGPSSMPLAGLSHHGEESGGLETDHA